MNDLETVRVTFTCVHCGTSNELTASNVHDATVIHCSNCGTSVATLALLRGKAPRPAPVVATPDPVLEKA